MSDDDFLPGTPVPRTGLYIGQPVYFKSVHDDFESDNQEAKVFAFALHETETYAYFPDKVAICIQFGPKFNLAKTWARKDEVFPLHRPTS